MTGATKPIIYTLGTSTRTEVEFIALLRHYGIETVVDVRSFPQSRFEHFKRDNLERSLEGEGIGYVYLGKELGGFRKGGYLAYTNTEAYHKGIQELEQVASGSITAFLCAERLPWKCHRRFIAASLEEKGWEVNHIIEKDRLWRPIGQKSS
jgi:uncharacterized protein (DUF488 family)